VLKHESRARSQLTAAQTLSSYNGPDAKLDPDAIRSIVEWLAVRA
jgi:hypothetical protein